MKFLKAEIESSILAQFEKINLEFYKSDTNWKISVFINTCDQSQELELLWSDISSAIGAIYQSRLNGVQNEFEKWNIYVLYLCRETIEKELKYKIENDKFSSRKIVEDNFKSELTNEVVNKMIATHITNTDLELELLDKNQFEVEYVSDNAVWKIVSSSSLIKGDREEQKSLLQEVIKNVTNEN